MGQGAKRVFSVEDWAEIWRLRRSERLAISEIARVLGISRNTVKAQIPRPLCKAGVFPR
jgi:transposase-like protein